MSQYAWTSLLELDEHRRRTAGDEAKLRAAVGRGADLRIYSEFCHNEHIDTSSADDQVVQETMDMRTTYLVENRWCAGILTLRQPVALPGEFGPRPSLSLFMYNEDGTQAIARPHLDGVPTTGECGANPTQTLPGMEKYRELDRWDDGTNAPSCNFLYDFARLKYLVRDDWTEVLHHGPDGAVRSGSLAELQAAFAEGAEIKVGIANLCQDLAPREASPLPHEVFMQCGSCYYYTESKLLIASTHPLVRVAPGIPLRYASGNWDYSWLIARTDGQVAQLRYDPYTLLPTRSMSQHAIRWFVR